LINLLTVIITMSHPVKLSDIEDVSLQHLSSKKLEALNSGKSPDGPIKLRRSTGKPYYILDGRHRIYLARQAGKSLIEVNFDDD
jgi:hypothetical protein